MVSFTSLLAAGAAFLGTQTAHAATGVDPSVCQCFRTNGTSPAYFAHYKFFDFRNIANPRVPAAINNRAQALAAPVTHAYFNTTNFTNTWSIQAWTDSGAVYNEYSKNDVYIESNSDTNANSKTWLTLRTYRHPASNGNFQSSAELQSISGQYQYVSMRMYARTKGAAGAVTAMFTYKDAASEANVQEADTEFLTSDANNQVHYTNQPATVNGTSRPNATKQVKISGTWSNWRVHRYDWTPGKSDWYVDGTHMLQNTYQAPVDPTTLLFNAWSDGGSWSGAMASGQSAYLQIQWIELIYNNTAEPSSFKQCAAANICSFDLGTAAGVPALSGAR
ncbi:glycoside hydrolase family 16 protein [Annulohypoxylon maeteangense]|uniref:glycoside hydrolase family 16 protein n=1 Tax=Annulohypoxylon maeteangense TaxID=1927788 RepID=UPI00200780C6|nr:glycoside hydrolase family 16 protein [Annulohypoxylon maeteangense]KAI0887812.1 glycoside hydrolase family 16 protein [Annulohypoxylon maeteangense]